MEYLNGNTQIFMQIGSGDSEPTQMDKQDSSIEIIWAASRKDQVMGQYEDLYRIGHVRTAGITEPDDFIVEFSLKLRQRNARRILDVGCGAGRNMVFLAREEFMVVGLDISPTAVKLASKRADDENVKNCMFVAGSFLDLPFSDAQFDAAFSSYGIENGSLSGIKSAFNEMKRVVRDVGMMLVTLHSTRHWRFGKGRQIGPHTFLTSDTIEGKQFRFVSHFFGEEDARRLFQELYLKILSIKEVVKVTDKQRAHWIVVSEK